MSLFQQPQLILCRRASGMKPQGIVDTFGILFPSIRGPGRPSPDYSGKGVCIIPFISFLRCLGWILTGVHGSAGQRMS